MALTIRITTMCVSLEDSAYNWLLVFENEPYKGKESPILPNTVNVILAAPTDMLQGFLEALAVVYEAFQHTQSRDATIVWYDFMLHTSNGLIECRHPQMGLSTENVYGKTFHNTLARKLLERYFEINVSSKQGRERLFRYFNSLYKE